MRPDPSGIAKIIPQMLHAGVTQVYIESRGLRQDERDKGTILDALKNFGSSGSLNYDWHGMEELSFGWLSQSVELFDSFSLVLKMLGILTDSKKQE